MSQDSAIQMISESEIKIMSLVANSYKQDYVHRMFLEFHIILDNSTTELDERAISGLLTINSSISEKTPMIIKYLEANITRSSAIPAIMRKTVIQDLKQQIRLLNDLKYKISMLITQITKAYRSNGILTEKAFERLIFRYGTEQELNQIILAFNELGNEIRETLGFSW